MKTKNVTEKNMKVCLVGSSGGHLTHLYMLKPFWKDKNRFWVTFDKEDARSLLEGEKVYPCYFPTNRSIKALIKNTKIAWDPSFLTLLVWNVKCVSFSRLKEYCRKVKRHLFNPKFNPVEHNPYEEKAVGISAIK